MKKYVALYMAPAAVVAELTKLTPQQGKAEMEAWMAWEGKHKAGILDLGAPLGKTTRVTAAGVADVKNEVTGYTIVQADSRDAAARMFTDHPHVRFPGAYVDVLDWIDVNQMLQG